MATLKIEVTPGVFVPIPRGEKGDSGTVAIAAQLVGALPSAYPEGVSFFYNTDALWPGTGMVVTWIKNGLGTQVLYRSDGVSFTRPTATTTTWGAWTQQGSNLHRVVYAAGAWPVRPVGAQYVDWIGPTQPPGMVTGDTWTPTNP